MKSLFVPLLASSFAVAAFLVPMPAASVLGLPRDEFLPQPLAPDLPHDHATRSPLRTVSQKTKALPLAQSEEDLLNAIADETSRTHALPEALSRPGIAIWILRRLEEADIPKFHAPPLGWLLRGALLLRDSLPDGLPLPFDSYLDRVFRAASLHSISAEAVIWAWHGVRLLEGRHDSMVANTRPAFPLSKGFRSQLHLALLEDLYRAFLEDNNPDPVFIALADPWPSVRSIARKLLLESGRSWQDIAAQSAVSTPAEIHAWGSAIVQQLQPPEAAQALLHLENITQAEELFGPWSLLASQSPIAVAQAWEDLLSSASIPRGPVSLNSSWQEGKVRQRVLLALSVGAPGDPATRATLDRAVWQEPNPLVRIAAWTALAEAKDQKSRTLALARLQAPDRRAALSLGNLGTSPLVDGFRALIRRATPAQRIELTSVLDTLGLDPTIQNDFRHMLTGL